jgi:hypothetical protein
MISLPTEKANFNIFLGFSALSFLLTLTPLDFCLHISILNTASLFYECLFS